MSGYDAVFFRYVNSTARAAAETIVPLLHEQLNCDSVLDVGCGQGAWLAVWRSRGVTDTCGLDGAYVDRSRLQFPASCFLAHDLRTGFDLGRRFSLVQCLEVAEHLPADCAETLLESLALHGEVILFSAAPPGQGGHGHVNERGYEYWRAGFSSRGYACLDFLRPRLLENRRIAPWYRYNPLLYVHHARLAGLTAALRSTLLPGGAGVPDVSPPLYRLRKRFLRHFPAGAMTAFARLKERTRGLR